MSWEQLGGILLSQATSKKIPLVGQFELTSRCNLQCKMCYVRQPINDKTAIAKEHTAKEWIKVAEEARNAGMLYLLLTGGELFLHPGFKEIYEAICSMGLCTQIYSNATMITPEIAKWLGKIPPSKIGITLYGSSPETYKKVSGSSVAFKNALNAIRLLLDEGITVMLKTTLIKDNVQDFKKLSEIAENLGTDFKIVNYISPRREGCITSPEEVRLGPAELAEYESFITNYFNEELKMEQNTQDVQSVPFNNDELTDDVEEALVQNMDGPFSCVAGKASFAITCDGRMTPCGLMRAPASLPFKNGFSNAWKELQEMCAAIPVCKECKACDLREYCMSCPARLKNETGAYDKPAPYLCELAQRRKLLK
jgi:radical SAM protein with 4Fe4S-binding SPASM domain